MLPSEELGETDPFRQAIDALPVLVWITDGDLRIVEQRGGAPSRGLTPVGESIREHWGPADPVGAIADHERALAGASVVSEASIEGRTLSFRLEPRHAAGVVGVGLDVTAERELQAELLHAHRLEALGQFTSGIAHDFNNMLVAILGNVDLALARIDDPAARRNLGSAREAATRSSDLVAQLLAYARKQVLRPKSVDLNEEIRAAGRFLAAGLGERTRLRFRLAPSLPRASVDPSQFEQVLVNLVVNARDATEGDGTIVVSTRHKATNESRRVTSGELIAGEWVEMAVSDSGAGIDPDALSLIFEPFYTTKESGTGLGLATVFGIVLQSGGQLHVTSTVGRGTTVHVFLPLADR